MCSTPVNVSSIKKRVTQKYSPSIEIFEIRLLSLPNLPPQYHTTNGLSPHLMSTLKKAFEMSILNFAKILQTLNPDLVIYDFKLPGAVEYASSVNIPAAQFLTYSAAVIAFWIDISYKLGEMFPFPAINLCEYEILSLKKLLKDLAVRKFPFDEGLRRSQDIILMKTCRVLDDKYMDYLSSLVSKKIVPVGTLDKESTNRDDHEETMQWLDKKHKGSTVFVSFGSEFPQGERISIRDALQEDNLERVGERGIVMEGWAPQATILQHSSIGGFVSHWMEFFDGKHEIWCANNCHAYEAAREEDGKLQSKEIAKAIRKVVVEEVGRL
ncbi:hypothetical protein P3S67_026514 [Capsicum chacoense]